MASRFTNSSEFLRVDDGFTISHLPHRFWVLIASPPVLVSSARFWSCSLCAQKLWASGPEAASADAAGSIAKLDAFFLLLLKCFICFSQIVQPAVFNQFPFSTDCFFQLNTTLYMLCIEILILSLFLI